MLHQAISLIVHLGFNQVTNCAGGRRSFLLFQGGDRLLLVIHILRFDRKTQPSVLSVDIDDLCLD